MNCQGKWNISQGPHGAVGWQLPICFGRLRQMLCLSLFEDESWELVFDGLLAHGAGARRGAANWRFGQPSYLVQIDE